MDREMRRRRLSCNRLSPGGPDRSHSSDRQNTMLAAAPRRPATRPSRHRECVCLGATLTGYKGQIVHRAPLTCESPSCATATEVWILHPSWAIISRWCDLENTVAG